MAKKQMNHQYSGSEKLQQLTSNKGPLLPTPALWFHLPRGNLIITKMIMVMLKFTIHIFRLSLTPNHFQIQTPLWLNQTMKMKRSISYNSSIQNMMKILWMLTSRCFKIDWWSPLLQKLIQYLLWSFINTEKRMLESKIACHNFPCLSQPRPLWNWLMETRDMPK